MHCCARQVQREAAAEHAAATARSTAVGLVEPFGSLLIAITAPSASDLRNRESIEAATALLSSKNYAEALVQLNDVLAEPERLQPAEAAELYEMRAVCYKSLSCFDDADADQQAAQQRLDVADSEGDVIADMVLGICGSGGGDDDEAAPDPCLGRRTRAWDTIRYNFCADPCPRPTEPVPRAGRTPAPNPSNQCISLANQ